jgi:hypothetical protein
VLASKPMHFSRMAHTLGPFVEPRLEPVLQPVGSANRVRIAPFCNGQGAQTGLSSCAAIQRAVVDFPDPMIPSTMTSRVCD